MPEKLTLAVYLERRGAVKALTRIEAEVFGVPYPLVKGWAHRHGATEITQAMLKNLELRISTATSVTAKKAQDGLERATRTEASQIQVEGNISRKVRLKTKLRNKCNSHLFPGFSLFC